jgi:hypothetical protein
LDELRLRLGEVEAGHHGLPVHRRCYAQAEAGESLFPTAMNSQNDHQIVATFRLWIMDINRIKMSNES